MKKHKAAVKAAMNRPEVKEKHKAAINRPEVKEKPQASMNRPEVKEKHKAAVKAAMNRPEDKEKHKAAINRPEFKEKCIEAHLERQAKKRKEVFKPTDLATANSTASAVLGGKSYAWMKPGGSSQQG